ncbi:MAG: hypothetical protein AAGD17_05245 [Bacteroidota bacterium]
MADYKNIGFGWLMALMLALTSCGGGDSAPSDEQPPDNQPQPQAPAKAVGTLPANGEPCSDFEEIAGEATRISVLFQWNSAASAEDYTLNVLENQTVVSSQSTKSLSASVTLDRGKTYTWSVETSNEAGETTGDTYSFTTPGVPIGNYAPYAAEISVVFDAGSLQIQVSWEGSDEDGDELSYDVSITENESLLFEDFDLSANSIAPITYNPSSTYGIEVVSKDGSGNFSISRISATAPN